MAVVNTSVFSEQTKRTILPWTIVQLVEESHTFNDFFMEIIKPKMNYSDCQLLSASIGPDKISLDPVDMSLQVLPVLHSFGRFLKYYVEIQEDPIMPNDTASVGSIDGVCRLAFVTPVTVRNKKDQLYNDLIDLFVSHNALLEENEVVPFGKELVTCLRNVLWYVDGYQAVFAERAIPVPSLFQRFTNYNLPQMSKHRKRRTVNISSDELNSFVQDLCTILQCTYWDRQQWKELKLPVTELCESVAGYVEYLSKKNKKTKVNHRSPTPIREVGDNLRLKFLPKADCSIPEQLRPIDVWTRENPEYTYLPLMNYTPNDPIKKHRFMTTLESTGLSVPCILLVYSPGSNVGNLQFLWKVPDDKDVSECFERSQAVVESVKQCLPVYHTRAMRASMFQKFGRISPKVKPAVLRYFYRDLTGDQSASDTTSQSEVDARITDIIDMEDVNVLPDLRALNSGQKTRFDCFWAECDKFLSEDVGTSVDDRRHGLVAHLARAISIRDLVNQVKARCPEGTEIPSTEWVRIQFWPKTPSSKASVHYTGRFKLKFMVQQRQWRRYHVDAHYAAAYFRYMREYAICVRDHCLFISIDDKHKVQIGEPDCPVASAERGRRVLVRSDEAFTVADHDFTKFALIPSVVFIIDVPEEISDSWYHGHVFVGLKDTLFEPSSPFRHMCELLQIINSNPSAFSRPILFVYSDGGPDHRLTYISVQLSLICLFLKLDLDYLCACRTAPYHSWKNPVERVMSVLNLGLQSVGLARAEIPEAALEQEVAKCNTLSELRKIATKNSGFISAVQDSLSPVKVLLSNIFSRLCLHDRVIKKFTNATTTEISDFWSTLLIIDSSLRESVRYTKKNVEECVAAMEFMSHCCQSSHYSFDILKCGIVSCSLCRPVRLPMDTFKMLHHLPHPMPGEDDHYAPFTDVFGKPTTEEYRPSLKQKPKKNSLPFSVSVQHVKNTEMMVQCDECCMWRLIYSKYKLKKEQRVKLQVVLNNFTYTCGSILAELQLPVEFKYVEVRDHVCGDPIEKLYYSAKFNPICVYCGKDQPFTSNDVYPQCTDCIGKSPIHKK